jgi:hypothetical protein
VSMICQHAMDVHERACEMVCSQLIANNHNSFGSTECDLDADGSMADCHMLSEPCDEDC